MTESFVRKTIKLNKTLWDKFQKKIEEEYGTTYKHTSEEIQKAIENYIDNDVFEIEKTKSKINNLNVENKNLQKSLDEVKNENLKLSDELLLVKSNLKKSEDNANNFERKLTSADNEIILLKNKVENLEREVDNLTRSNNDLKEDNDKLIDENKNLEEKYIEQVEQTNYHVKENNKIKNKREHTQERLNKTQDELNDTLKRLEKYSFAIGQVKNMSFLDRLFNRLPEEIKELQPGMNDDNNG